MKITLSTNGCGAVCQVEPAGSGFAIGDQHTVYYKRHTKFGKIIARNANAERTAVARTVLERMETNAPVIFVGQ